MSGFTLWFTGLSGSGKSTLAQAAARELQTAGLDIELLDGDVVRQHLSKGLGFSKEDRDTNIRRIGFVASLITRHGGVAITAAISPYRAIRDEQRKLIGNFIEVFVDCPLEECERRDIKGLYKKARTALAEGKPLGFTGVDDAYEPPLQPEITVKTAQHTEAECLAQIMGKLLKLGLLSGAYTKNTAVALRDGSEFLPDELVAKAEAALRKAGRIHTDVLLQELHVGFGTAARLIDKLSGKITFK